MFRIEFLARRAGMAPCRPAIAATQHTGEHTLQARDNAPDLGESGFSLIELVIVIAIVAILAAVGYPSYVGYKVRANRAAAQVFLIDLAARQQLHFLDARTFAADLAQLGANPPPPDVAPYYAIPDPVVDNAATPPAFTLSAIARPGTVQARDGDLGLNSSGVRSGHW